MFSGGFLTVGRVRGAPVRIHWSAPLGAVAFTGFAFAPGLWAGFILLVIVHELGHAALVWRFGYRVTAIRVHAFGGDCQWEGHATPIEGSIVAWGGVLAEGVLWLATTLALLVFGFPSSFFLATLAVTFTSVNARMILFNLLPIPPLDGHRAWALFPMWWRARKELREHVREREARQRQRGREIARAKAPPARAEQAASQVEVADEDLAPMPPEVQAVLDRIAQGEKIKRERQ